MFAVRVYYQDAGDLSSDAGGLLLTLRKDSSLFLLAMLSQVLRPLSLLSKSLQPRTNDIITARQHAKAVTADFADFAESPNLHSVEQVYMNLNKRAVDQKVYIYIAVDNTTTIELVKVCLENTSR